MEKEYQKDFVLNVNQKEKIILEKRRRYQAYMAVDYLTSAVSYFDFFSIDCFEIVKKGKYLTELLKQKQLTSELLLLPFFESNSDIIKSFKDYGLSSEKISNLILSINKIEKESFSQRFRKFFKKNEPSNLKNIIYSFEVLNLFEKAADNALNRFKTPVISSEILFITLLEEKNSRAAKLLKSLVKDDVQWFLLRYNILKKLHNHESKIRGDVIKNHHYFAYLLKINLSDQEFESLLEKDKLMTGVLTFRNILISEVLKFNIFELLEKEVKISINKKRKYSN
jgi:hypothetical protein